MTPGIILRLVFLPEQGGTQTLFTICSAQRHAHLHADFAQIFKWAKIFKWSLSCFKRATRILPKSSNGRKSSNGLYLASRGQRGFCPNLQMGENQKSVFHCSQEASRQPRLQTGVVFKVNVTGCRQSSPEKEEACQHLGSNISSVQRIIAPTCDLVLFRYRHSGLIEKKKAFTPLSPTQ